MTRIELRPIEVLNLAVASLPPGAVRFAESVHCHACHCCGEFLGVCTGCDLAIRQPMFCAPCYQSMCEEWERGYED